MIRLTALIFLLGGILNAQDLTAPLLRGSWQATKHNPALLNELPGRVTIGLPGFTTDFTADRVGYRDLFVNENNRRVLDVTGLADLLAPRNQAQNDFAFSTLGIGIRVGDVTLAASHRIRSYGQLEYPRELVSLITRGNAQFIGQSVEIAPLGAAGSYHEIGIGASFAIDEKIALGGRINYLSGISDIRSSAAGSLRLTTETENYALTLDQEYVINTTGILAYNSFDDIDLTYQLNQLTFDNLFGANSGLAVDLGISVDLDKLQLQASVTDLGGNISWKGETTNLIFEGQRNFTGLDILQEVLLDSLNLDAATDTLLNAFEPEATNNEYNGPLDAAFYLGGQYALTDRLTVGVIAAYHDRYLGGNLDGALSARYALTDWLQLGTNITYINGNPNLGVHAYATPGAFQLILATDKLLTVLQQRGGTYLGVRIGAAYVIGKDD